MPATGAWLAVCAVLSAACAGAGEDPAAGDAGVGGTAPFRSALIGEPAPRVEPFRLELKSPGAEPRRLLRYQVPDGTREQTEIEVSSSIEVLVAGRRINKVTPPTTEVGFAIAVEAQPGRYRCSAWITAASSIDWERMAPGRGAELRMSLEQLIGHRFGFEVDDRGVPISAAITLPDKLENNRAEALQILKSVHSSVTPFPVEPIGIGAVWTAADAEPGRSNLAGPVTITYTLVAMRGDRIEMSMTLALPDQPAPLSLGGNELAVYSSGVTDGTMRIVVDLHRLLPFDFGGEIKSEVEGRSFVGSEVLPFKALSSTRERLRSR